MAVKVIFGFLRIWLGWQWLRAGLSKIISDVWTGEKAGLAITGFLNGSLTKSVGEHPEVHGWYAGFIEHIALPNARIFSYLVSYGELIAGTALIIGSLTLLASLASVFMNLNYLFAGTSGSNPEMLLVGILTVIYFVKAGYFGLDYYLNPVIAKKYNRFREYLGKKRIRLPEFKY